MMTDANLQFDMAARRHRPPKCDNCEVISYTDALLEPHRIKGAEALADYPGYLRECAACAALPDITYEWINDIDPKDFRKFIADHFQAFELEELRTLLKKK